MRFVQTECFPFLIRAVDFRCLNASERGMQNGLHLSLALVENREETSRPVSNLSLASDASREVARSSQVDFETTHLL